MKPEISVLILLLLSTAATAKTTMTSSTNYFKIQGQTAQQIYASLLTHAKGPGGHDAYATTSTRILQKASFTVGKSCSVKNYDVVAAFQISLPILKSSSPHPIIRSKWQGFADVLRRHEEHHRTLWMACARNFNRKVQTLTASNCKALNVKFTALWKATEDVCRQQNNAFDRAEQSRFLKQPFIQLVLQNK